MTEQANRLEYPADIRAELQRLGDETLELLDEDPAAAKDRARSQLTAIEQAQRQVGRELHKGQAFYNIGIAEAVRNVEAARAWFLAAHIEDARLPLLGDENVDNPAAVALIVVYGYDEEALAGIADRARADADVSPLEFAMLLTSEGTTDPLKMPFKQPGDEEDLARTSPDERVFVGGSYRFGWPTLVTIARGVRQAGMMPLVVQTFHTHEGESNRQKSFRFLHLCQSAVFDGTLDGGWQQELAEIANDPIPTLIVFGADKQSREPSHTTMLPNKDEIPDLEELPFVQPEELRASVARWLTVKVSRPEGRLRDARFVQPLAAAGSATKTTGLGSSTLASPDAWGVGQDAPVGSGGDYVPQQTEYEEAMDNVRRAEERLRRNADRLPPDLPDHDDASD